jgi:hypothetical protein
MADVDPFEALGIPPTLDLAQVKRAYFALLQRHPPHADPEGFRRVRAAYEALTAPGALGLAYATAPIAAAEELERWHQRWDAAMQQALAHHHETAARAAAIETFVATASKMALGIAVIAFAAPGTAGDVEIATAAPREALFNS